MQEHFRAFSFVDRIVSGPQDANVRGRYQIPSSLEQFPVSLVGEAIGQLAAWSAMASVDFKRRPVATIAGNVELLSAPLPGETVDLEVQMESVDAEAVGYSGAAFANGRALVRMQNCVGAMLPLEEFDDPEAVRNRFALLCKTGVAAGGFPGLPNIPLAVTSGEQGLWKRANLRVPTAAPFFCDHFPRRPLFPGTLLVNANLQLALTLAGEVADHGTSWRPVGVSKVKFRAFTQPGSQLECHAKVEQAVPGRMVVALESRDGEKLVGNLKAHFSAQWPE